MKIASRWPKLIAYSTLLLVFWLAAVPMQGQNSQGTVLGHVQDPTGAAVPGAKVTAKNVNTGVTNHFNTNSVGDYVFVDLIPGTYEIKVEADGFKSEVSGGLILEVDQTLRQNFTLEVGQIKEVMTITADAQMVQTDNTTLGGVLDQKLIEDLPSSGRDVTNFLELSAGATNLSGGSQKAYNSHGLNNNYGEVSLNGDRPESVSFMMDGVTDNEAFFGGVASIPNEFAVQEVKIQTGLYSAEYGQGSGQFNIAIKSGANQWHGQLYDYLQNDFLNPRSPLITEENYINHATTPTKTPWKQNQFGGTLGGPVTIPHLYNGHDKTFWFFSYDGGRRINTSGVSQTAQIPTAKEKSGDFSDWPYPIYDPATTGTVPIVPCPTGSNYNPYVPCNPTGRQQFSGNVIPPNRINGLGQKLANLYPNPNITCTLSCQNYIIPLRNTFVSNNETMRVDENLSDKDRLYFTGHIRRENSNNPNILPLSGSSGFTKGDLYGVSWERTFTSTIVNTLRLGYDHQYANSVPDTAYGPNLQAQLGFQNYPTLAYLTGIPAISLGNGYKNIGAASFGLLLNHQGYQLVDNLKFVRGKHSITVGADIRRLREHEFDNYTGIGGLNFTGAYSGSDPADEGAVSAGPNFGNAVADLLLGQEISLTPPAPLGTDNLVAQGINWNFFAQDDIRVTPNVTINLGLRYELPPNYHTLDNSGWNFDLANGGSLSWVSKSFVNSIISTAKGQGLTPYLPYLNCCAPNTIVPIDKRDFAPRIGMSWRPFGSDRFVVRAGYGIFYDTYMRYYDLVQNFDTNALQTTFANPNYSAGKGTERTTPEPVLNQLWLPTVTSAQFFSTTQPWNPNAFTSPILNQVDWPKNHNPYNQQWTLDTQYAVTPTLLLDVGYVGSHALRAPTYWVFNTATPPNVGSDLCNYLFDISQAPGNTSGPGGTGIPCATDPNFQPIDQRVPYPNVPPNFYANANILGSNYNALQTQLRQRYKYGLTYLVSYTWSRSFDEMSGIGNVTGNNGFVQDPHHIAADYGPANFDQPQRLTASAVWDMPVGKGKRFNLGPGNWILGGWKLSGIYTLTSGRTFSVYGYSGASPDEMGSGFTGRYRADQSGDPNSGITRSPSLWFNTNVFSAPPPGTYGNSEKGGLRGPYFENLDMSLNKVFPITERQHLQFRLDMFNVGSNWHAENDYYGSNLIPGSNVGSCNFGTVASIVNTKIPNCTADGTTPNARLWYPHTLQLSAVYSF
jgi:hypothetical protein